MCPREIIAEGEAVVSLKAAAVQVVDHEDVEGRVLEVTAKPGVVATISEALLVEGVVMATSEALLVEGVVMAISEALLVEGVVMATLEALALEGVDSRDVEDMEMSLPEGDEDVVSGGVQRKILAALCMTHVSIYFTEYMHQERRRLLTAAFKMGLRKNFWIL